MTRWFSGDRQSDGPRRPEVSVLTASLLAPGRRSFLLDLYADLVGARADWEWVIAVDGDHDRPVPEPIGRDARVRVLRLGRQLGAAAARNLALGLARGRYVTSADDDDHLPPGSLERRLAAAAGDRLGWVGGRLADLRDGVLTAWLSPMPVGHVAAGDLWRAWGCPCLPFPIGPTTLLVRSDLLRSVGGWHGLPQAEDFGMALAVTGRAPGRMLDRIVYAYRKHPGQMTTQRSFDTFEPLVRHVTFERGRLVAEQVRAARPLRLDR